MDGRRTVGRADRQTDGRSEHSGKNERRQEELQQISQTNRPAKLQQNVVKHQTHCNKDEIQFFISGKLLVKLWPKFVENYAVESVNISVIMSLF